jgi:hypothetical protein
MTSPRPALAAIIDLRHARDGSRPAVRPPDKPSRLLRHESAGIAGKKGHRPGFFEGCYRLHLEREALAGCRGLGCCCSAAGLRGWDRPAIRAAGDEQDGGENIG